MDVHYWTSLSEIVKNSFTSAGLLAGGAWAYWKFILKREAYPKIEFDVELLVIGHQDHKTLIEIAAVVANKGSVRHWLYDFQFDLFVLSRDDKILMGGDKINQQVFFNAAFKDKYWVPGWEGTFIDSGVSQRYSYIASIPDTTAFVLIKSRFRYPDKESESHVAQRTWSIREKRAVEMGNPSDLSD